MSEPAGEYSIELPPPSFVTIDFQSVSGKHVAVDMFPGDAIELALNILGDEARAWYARREMHKADREERKDGEK